ncbi:MAG: hypothetical protein ACI8ZB_003834 [Desulforhopalus sp.]|jgi:uncharacterized protein (TIGR02145 family)
MKQIQLLRPFNYILIILLIGLTSSKSFSETARQCKSVRVGAQEWMAENLKVSTYQNGENIPELKNNKEWLTAYRNESPGWCYYNNDPKNGKKYGKLYNWYAVIDSRGLCPTNWHIPTDVEWSELITTFGGTGPSYTKLQTSNGFSALPAGARDFETGIFHALNNITFWWSASKKGSKNAWYHAMHFGYKQVARDYGGMNAGHSVRCIKDAK